MSAAAVAAVAASAESAASANSASSGGSGCSSHSASPSSDSQSSSAADSSADSSPTSAASISKAESQKQKQQQQHQHQQQLHQEQHQQLFGSNTSQALCTLQQHQRNLQVQQQQQQKQQQQLTSSSNGKSSSSSGGSSSGSLSGGSLGSGAPHHHSPAASSSCSGAGGAPASASSSNVTAFLSKLWRMVNDNSNSDLIRWSQSGCSFVIINQIQFAKDLLPLYFKHSNMASFIRQLNMYGFRKIPLMGAGGSAGNLAALDQQEQAQQQQQQQLAQSRVDIAQFYHINFMRGQEQRLASIKRKNNSSKTHSLVVNGSFCDEVRSMLNDVESIRDCQNSSESILGAMRSDNKSLWRDVAVLRNQHHKQRRVIEKLIQFLLSLIQNRNNMVRKRKMKFFIGPSDLMSSSASSQGAANGASQMMDAQDEDDDDQEEEEEEDDDDDDENADGGLEEGEKRAANERRQMMSGRHSSGIGRAGQLASESAGQFAHFGGSANSVMRWNGLAQNQGQHHEHQSSPHIQFAASPTSRSQQNSPSSALVSLCQSAVMAADQLAISEDELVPNGGTAASAAAAAAAAAAASVASSTSAASANLATSAASLLQMRAAASIQSSCIQQQSRQEQHQYIMTPSPRCSSPVNFVQQANNSQPNARQLLMCRNAILGQENINNSQQQQQQQQQQHQQQCHFNGYPSVIAVQFNQNGASSSSIQQQQHLSHNHHQMQPPHQQQQQQQHHHQEQHQQQCHNQQMMRPNELSGQLNDLNSNGQAAAPSSSAAGANRLNSNYVSQWTANSYSTMAQPELAAPNSMFSDFRAGSNFLGALDQQGARPAGSRNGLDGFTLLSSNILGTSSANTNVANGLGSDANNVQNRTGGHSGRLSSTSQNYY